MILIDTTFGIPIVESTGGTMNPDGVNNWDAADNTLYLVQVAGANVSTGVITNTTTAIRCRSQKLTLLN